MHDVISQFRAAMTARNIVPPAEILADGNLHRCDAEGAGGQGDAAYVLHLNGVPAGGFTNWRDGQGWQKWRADSDRPMTGAEKAAYGAKIDAARLRKEADKAQRESEARLRAVSIWERSQPCQGHDYLTRKGIQAHGVRVFYGRLVVPILDASGVIQSLQFIDANGQKKYLAGGRIAGGFYILGEPGGGILCIAEGFATAASIFEATGYAVVVAFDAGNLLAVAEVIRQSYPDHELYLCADDDYQTAGNPGMTKAAQAAKAVGAFLAVPDFGANRSDGATDFNDLRDPSAIVEAVQKATPPMPVAADSPHHSEPVNSVETLVQAALRLATLPRMEYDRVRAREAKALGVRTATLDAEVKMLRAERERVSDAPFADIAPEEGPVDGAKLLSEVASVILRFVVCDLPTAHAAALFIAMTWLIDAVKVAPLAVITAPEMACGKSRLLEVMGKLVKRPLAASNITPAAMFRSIDAWHPTLLIDETDTFLKENEALRGILNAGHTRSTAYVVRVVGDEFKPVKFNVWGAKVLCGIGKLPPTIMSRSIPLVMRRKLPHESIDSLRHADEGLFDTLAGKLSRFAIDSSPAVSVARPALPRGMSDREQDNWEPLFAIAHAAGGPWPAYASAAAEQLSKAFEQPKSASVELLADIQEIFSKKKVDRISSEDLVKALCEDEEKRWATFNTGSPITPAQIAKRLREFQIVSKTRRFGAVTAKGYLRNQFEDAFARYLSMHDGGSTIGVTPSQPACDGAFGVTSLPPCYAREGGAMTSDVTSEANVGAACDGVTLFSGNDDENMAEVTL